MIVDEDEEIRPSPARPTGHSRNSVDTSARRNNSIWPTAPSTATSTSTATPGKSPAACPSRPTGKHGRSNAKTSPTNWRISSPILPAKFSSETKRASKAIPGLQGYHDGHLRRNVIGAVNPSNGQLVSLIVPHCDTEVFQAFLDTMAAEALAGKGKRIFLVLDNASWHKTKRLDWHHIEPVYLPPYSPDFNPIERFWQHLKSHHLAGFITKDGEALGEKILQAIRSLLLTPETIRSVCRTHTE